MVNILSITVETYPVDLNLYLL